MITRPDLTDKNKEWFITEYKAILKQLPEDKRDSLANEVISWNLDMPQFALNSPQKLSRRLADKFVSLMNRLKGRNFPLI